MIPISMNKRSVGVISSQWEVEEKPQNIPNNEDNEDNEDEFSQVEYQQLREQINELYNNQIEPNKDTNINSYKYTGLNILNDNLDDYFTNIEGSEISRTVHICAYHVNEQHQYPFLEYFLYKNSIENGEILQFPKFEYTDKMNVIMKSITILEVMSNAYYKNSEYIFKGYTNDLTNLYLFFDCSNYKLDGVKMNRANDLWVVTIDEIINQQKACNFIIDNFVIDFFKNNNELLYLTDTHDEVYETPIVLYSGCSRKNLEFMTTFGITPSGIDALMGQYYYFTDYQNAIKMSGWLDENVGWGGLIRCAIFLGKMKAIMNHVEDNVDESIATQNILSTFDQNSKEYKKNALMLRITDRDGLWAKDYNSVYIGRIELDDGSIYDDYPLWVVKDYEQQVMLSSHIIDKKTLREKWSREDEYFTL